MWANSTKCSHTNTLEKQATKGSISWPEALPQVLPASEIPLLGGARFTSSNVEKGNNKEIQRCILFIFMSMSPMSTEHKNLDPKKGCRTKTE